MGEGVREMGHMTREVSGKVITDKRGRAASCDDKTRLLHGSSMHGTCAKVARCEAEGREV